VGHGIEFLCVLITGEELSKILLLDDDAGSVEARESASKVLGGDFAWVLEVGRGTSSFGEFSKSLLFDRTIVFLVFGERGAFSF
jgi:hypothetical protein